MAYLPGISRVTVSGYKSIVTEHSIEIRPLTVLAGPNSSGKSSIMQPLLLLKQTLESSYDPGSLLIDGNNVRFTSVSQMLSRAHPDSHTDTFSIGIELEDGPSCILTFTHSPTGWRISQRLTMGEHELSLNEELFPEELASSLKTVSHEWYNLLTKTGYIPKVARHRRFLYMSPSKKDKEKYSRLAQFVWDNISEDKATSEDILKDILNSLPFSSFNFASVIVEIIHLPGLRGNPERVYPRSISGPKFPGTFETYTASVIAEWQ